jgi:hypothetical protein
MARMSGIEAVNLLGASAPVGIQSTMPSGGFYTPQSDGGSQPSGVWTPGQPLVQASAQSTSPTTGQPSAVTYWSNQPWFPWVTGALVGLLIGIALAEK